MQLITPQEPCVRDGLSPACKAGDPEEAARRDATAKLCARLFPNELVSQAACKTNCAHNTAKESQECAFHFARTSRDIAPEADPTHGVLWSFVIVIPLLAAACWAGLRYQKQRRDLDASGG